MNNKQCRPGYILLLVLMGMSLATVLVTYIFNSGSIHVPFIRSMIDREKAKQLALSGIQVAISQLSQEIEWEDAKDAQTSSVPEQIKKDPSKAAQLDGAKELFERIVPTINRWQVFQLKEEVDGIDGAIKICLMSEEGKLNINALFDFKKHTFKGSVQQQEISKALLAEVFKKLGKEKLFDEFQKFLKNRTYRLDDVTELLTIKGFDAFKNNIFYEPPAVSTKKKQMDLENEETKNVADSGDKKDKDKVYLTDIFTVWSGKLSLDPWLLSDSLCGLLGVKRALRGDIETRKQIAKQLTKEFKIEVQFPADWKKLFEPFYGVEFTSLQKGIEFVMNTKFEPKIFSVLSYGTVGTVTQKMLAILERVKGTEDKRITYNVIVRKIYWL